MLKVYITEDSKVSLYGKFMFYINLLNAKVAII